MPPIYLPTTLTWVNGNENTIVPWSIPSSLPSVDQNQDKDEQEAWKKAEALLLEHLDEEQAEEWGNDRAFDVVAKSGTKYKVHTRSQSVTDRAKDVWYCLQPDSGAVPDPDVALTHKLWLEADEEGFLRTANCFPLRLQERERSVGVFWGILADNGLPVEAARECMARRLADAQRAYQVGRVDLEEQYRHETMELDRRYQREVEDAREQFERDQRVSPENDIVFRDSDAVDEFAGEANDE